MKKPRILIAMHYLEIGGAESALVGLLRALDPSRVDVDLFLHAHRGEMMRHVPEWVRLLPEIRSYAAIEAPIKEALRRGCFGVALGRWRALRNFGKYLRRKGISDWSGHYGYVARYVSPWLPSLRRFGRYDLAVSFLAPHEYVLRKVDATRRVCWIHSDYSRFDVDAALELPVWDGYDRIASISADVTETFCKRFPSLRSKIVEIENIAPADLIREGAGAGRPADMPAAPGRTALLTIGRYSYPKNLESIPALCRGLTERGIDAEWYVIGYGADDTAIRRAIAAEGMHGRVHLLGKRDNPYPYIAACDWYVQPSRYEGKSVAVREAQILGRPVIVTAYPTAPAQVRDGVDGVIVPMQREACIEAMARAVADEALRKRIIDNITAGDYSNAGEVEKFYRLAEV
ncbi:MAG: glycosyltransferase [Muribaculaceae bacterium]|nr:glycosyltransferase [Muribaculaceae bacterium]